MVSKSATGLSRRNHIHFTSPIADLTGSINTDPPMVAKIDTSGPSVMPNFQRGSFSPSKANRVPTMAAKRQSASSQLRNSGSQERERLNLLRLDLRFRRRVSSFPCCTGSSEPLRLLTWYGFRKRLASLSAGGCSRGQRLDGIDSRWMS